MITTHRPPRRPRAALREVRGPSGRLWARINVETLQMEFRKNDQVEVVDLRPYLAHAIAAQQEQAA